MSEDDRRFYVYVHKYKSGHKKDKVFYVGKGTGYRHKTEHSRNTWWKKIVSKYGFYSEIIIDKISNEKAKDLEVSIISEFRRSGVILCNITDGGDGSTGAERGIKTRELISSSAKSRYSDPRKHPRSDNSEYTWWNADGSIFLGSVFDICEFSCLPICDMRRVSNGTLFSYKGWKRVGVRNYSERESISNNTCDKSVFILNKDGFPTFIGLRSDFCRFYSYESNKVYSFFSGKTKSMDGWSLGFV